MISALPPTRRGDCCPKACPDAPVWLDLLTGTWTRDHGSAHSNDYAVCFSCLIPFRRMEFNNRVDEMPFARAIFDNSSESFGSISVKTLLLF